MGIAYLDGPRLRRSLAPAADWVEAGREELNRIDVLPVSDGDTWTNFSITLRGVVQALDPLERAPLAHVTSAMANAGVLGAHGNVGPGARGIFYQLDQPAGSGGRNPAATPTP